MTTLTSSRRQLFLGAAATTLAASPAMAAARRRIRPAAAKAAEAVCARLLAATPVPALSIAVAGAGGALWSAVYGKANLELDVAARDTHLFKLGSVGKVLTATAAARLASRGIIDIDAPITRWLPDLPEQHRKTTLRFLLTHRGGIRHYALQDYAPDRPGGSIDQHAYATNRDILAIFINDPLIGPVGGEQSYSTYGYTLASLVMESAAGRPFPELLKAEIGTQFGLLSLEEDDPYALKAGRVCGYSPAQMYKAADPRLTEGWANAPRINPAYKWGGGGLLMTSRDLAAFGAGHLDAPSARITAAERALLFTPMTEATRNSPPLGLGWRVDHDARGRLRWHHAGAQEGCRSSLVVYPELKLAVALASNGSAVPGNVLSPSSDLADAFA